MTEEIIPGMRGTLVQWLKPGTMILWLRVKTPPGFKLGVCRGNAVSVIVEKAPRQLCTKDRKHIRKSSGAGRQKYWLQIICEGKTKEI